MPPDIADYNQAVADLVIIRERPAKSGSVPASFISAFLRHPAGLHQVQRCIPGLRGGHIYAQDLKEQVLIPDLGKSKLHTFDSMWTLAERTRAQAQDLMMDATEKLEEWLDSAGADAAWLTGVSIVLLLRCADAFRDTGRNMSRVLAMTDINRLLSIYPSLDTAVSAGPVPDGDAPSG